MHILGDDQRTERSARAPIEKYFRRFYQLIATGQLACIIAMLVLLAETGGRTFDGVAFWGSSPTLLLHPEVRAALDACPIINRTYTLRGGEMINLTMGNVEYFIGDSIQRVYLAVGITAGSVIASLLNTIAFDFNVRALRLLGVVVWKDVLTAANIALVAISFPAITGAEYSTEALKQYLRDCGVNVVRTYLTSVPLVALYVSSGLGIASFAFAVMAALYYGLEPHPRDTQEIVTDDFGDEIDRRYTHHAIDT